MIVSSCAGYTFKMQKQNDPKVAIESKRISIKTKCTSESSIETRLKNESNELSFNSEKEKMKIQHQFIII